jgi:hypothetical protein
VDQWPFPPASQSGNKMFNQPQGLNSQILDGKQAVGDGNYTNNFPKLSTYHVYDTAEVRELKSWAALALTQDFQWSYREL